MTYYKVFGWVVVAIGALGMFGSLDPFDGMALFGCGLFFVAGAVILSLTEKVK